MALERIIITFTQSGEFRGASAQDFAGLPLPAGQPELEALLPTINTAALARVADLEAKIASKDAPLAEIEASLLDDKLDDAATLAAITAKIEEAKLPAKTKEIAELERRIAELEAKKAELEAQPVIAEPIVKG